MDRRERVESLFQELRMLIVECDLYLKAHPEVEAPLFTRQDQEVSDSLQAEINRLLRVEGCRELLNEMLTQNASSP